MKNFEVEDKNTGKKYWISRSVAVLALVVVTDEPNGEKMYFAESKDEIKEGDKILNTTRWANSNEDGFVEKYDVENSKYIKNKYVLVNKRGDGTPNFQGYWNIPVGYLDYNETLKQACTREVMEEQGVYIDAKCWTIYLPIDDVVCAGDSKQNVTVRFVTYLTMDEYNKAVELGKKKRAKYKGEYNEVSDAELMPLTKENIESKKWAFNHRTLLEYQLEGPLYID